jgi:hypothetical protein
MRPMRVLKGKKLPGHMGNEQITIQNLMIVDVDKENKYILVSGNVPGPKNSFVFIRAAVKGSKDFEKVELISYEETVEETPANEVVNNEAVVEESNVTENEVETTEEVKEETTSEEVSE